MYNGTGKPKQDHKSGAIHRPVGSLASSAEGSHAYDRAHVQADTDHEVNSIHHTIGDKPTQAASGAELANLKKRVETLEAQVASLLGE